MEKLMIFLASLVLVLGENNYDGLVLQENNHEVFTSYEKFKERVQEYNPRVSSGCNEQFAQLNANNSTALYDLYDATSKWPWSGLRVGSVYDFGSYDQCINFHHTYNDSHGTVSTIKGKYCVPAIIVPTNTVAYSLANCMPDKCTAMDYREIFNYSLIFDNKCHTKEDLRKYTTTDYIMIAVLGHFLAMMIIATAFDVYLYKNKKKSPHSILIAFSVFSNGKKLVQTTKGSKEQIQIFHGMKTFSMAWIIAGHAMGAWLNYPVFNREDVLTYRAKLKVFYISTAVLAVDTFFFISGFLLVYMYLKQKNKPEIKHVLGVPYMIVHRYFRLTPAVAMLYFFSITLFKHMGSGPLWQIGMETIIKPCHKYWWSFFLYIQNYYNPNEFCLIHSWYLSADMQLFLISLVFIILLAILLSQSSKNFKLAMIMLVILNLTFTFLPMATKLIFSDYNNEYDTHSRIISYTMGIMMGVFMREAKDKPFFYGKIRNKSLINLVIWIVVLFVLLACSLLQQDYTTHHSRTAQSIAISLIRPAWCLALCWMVYSCYHGYGGIINWILTRPTLQITSKLSYCMYLMHALVVGQFSLATRSRLWFDEYTAFIRWCGYFIMTLALSVIWTLAFESPLIIIEKIIFSGGATRKPKRKQEEANITRDAVIPDENKEKEKV